ncbi:class I adenylate-forming enzyme family protein [Candidatus Halocynthiibacter alkanivorans]|uniref:class I adenylate-forming enzyme family protein n=1 Tax=Candidatus Halocynthiibacter alkanivorans TaxID=2267619 RepID=UPI000DF2578B|nr:AMP-binding protein [Candidatus Halocynthiibacter alkanivorans]
MNPANWLARSAALTPAAPALLSGLDIIADYGTFARRAASIARALSEQHGVGPGDRVAILMHNCTQYLEVMYGIWWLGAAAVPINAKLHAREAAWIVEDAGARVVFTCAKTQDAFAPIAPDCVTTVFPAGSDDYTALYAHSAGADTLSVPARMSGDDMIWLFYTSGTTGRPKGVMMTCANIQAMILGYTSAIGAHSARDATLYAAPMSHGAGIYNFMHVMTGGRHICPKSGGFDEVEIQTLAPQVGRISMFAAPTMVRRMVDHAKATGGSGEGIDTIIYAGGPMYLADILEAVEVMGPRFAQIYGQGECPMAITALTRAQVADRTHPDWRNRLASVGTAQVASLVQVVGADMALLPAGEIGEIVVSGAAVMKGYWQNETATADTIVDGWLKTGDMGALDADGFLTLHDRSKDMIISGGSNIYPREVEEVLLGHPDVAEVAVVGRKDEEWGETVVAFVVAAPGTDLSRAALDQLCRDHIARFKRPREYVFLDALPKNNYGKVVKRDLREMLADAPPAST